MRHSKIVLILVVLLSANAFAGSSEDQAMIEYEKQISKFWSQANQTDQQLLETGKQLNTTSQMLNQQQKQLDKQAALLERWERILERHEKLLESWERNEAKTHNKAN